MDDGLFSLKLKAWLGRKERRTFESLSDVFGEKSFAAAILILMAVPALPLPTGGITHIFEIIAALLAGEMILGFDSIWLPKRWRKLQLGKLMQKQAIPKLIGLIGWFEKRFRPYQKSVFEVPGVSRLTGLVLLAFIVTAFLAPPFSGLDTLPSLGTVIICLSIILDNLVLALLGIATGTLGLSLILVLGKAVFKLLG